MLDLKTIPLFSGLSPTTLERLEELTQVQFYSRGTVICRRGEMARALWAISEGGVNVHLGEEREHEGLFLGPGQVFGELSLLSGMPISATVEAATDSRMYSLNKDDFHSLLGADPSLYAPMSKLLIDRLRHRTGRDATPCRGTCVVLVVEPDSADGQLLYQSLCRVIDYYCPNSFHAAMHRKSEASGGGRVVARSAAGATVSASDYMSLVEEWRASATMEQFLSFALSPADARAIGHALKPMDVVIRCHSNSDRAGGRAGPHSEVARSFRVSVVEDASAPPSPHATGARDAETGSWSFRVSRQELQRAAANREPDSTRQAGRQWIPEPFSSLGRLGRWITHRDVGIALGCGAARGLAHLGVLQVLDEEGIAPDYLCGTSMGGIIALLYGLHGGSAGAIEAAQRWLRTENLREFSWWPRSSFLMGRRLVGSAVAAFGDATFADLNRPVAVVAADLVSGEKLVVDGGSLSRAALATSAIPGAFPPVDHRGRLLVDGGLVSRTPTELLRQGRCGLSIAVNISPQAAASLPAHREAHERLRTRFNRFLGLRHVIATSWDLMATYRGAEQAQQADIILEPRTGSIAGYDFSKLDEMIMAGRSAASERIDALRQSFESLLRPGVP